LGRIDQWTDLYPGRTLIGGRVEGELRDLDGRANAPDELGVVAELRGADAAHRHQQHTDAVLEEVVQPRRQTHCRRKRDLECSG